MMTNSKDSYPKFDHDEYAKTRAPDDFWGQIRRTVGGKPVSEDQIRMIVEAVTKGLAIETEDVLLDLACGNGALSSLLFDRCQKFLGVDFSEFLISIAKKNFETPNYYFIEQSASEYVQLESHPERFTKVLCYGSFSYFPEVEAAKVLHLLFSKFNNVQRVFIGNLPDKERAMEFYKGKVANVDELSDCSSQIGIWRSRSEFEQLASHAGWKVKFTSMPAEFYAAHYRYDVLLTR